VFALSDAQSAGRLRRTSAGINIRLDLIGKILDFGPQRTRDCRGYWYGEEDWPCGKEEFDLHEENVR